MLLMKDCFQPLVYVISFFVDLTCVMNSKKPLCQDATVADVDVVA